MLLRQPQFVYSACGPFTRHKERIKEFKRNYLRLNSFILSLCLVKGPQYIDRGYIDRSGTIGLGL